MEAVLCIDLGGTKSAASLVTRSGEIIYRTAEHTPAHASGNDLAAFLISLGKKVIQSTAASPIGIGVSVGGPADARRGKAWAAPALPVLLGVMVSVTAGRRGSRPLRGNRSRYAAR